MAIEQTNTAGVNQVVPPTAPETVTEVAPKQEKEKNADLKKIIQSEIEKLRALKANASPEDKAAYDRMIETLEGALASPTISSIGLANALMRVSSEATHEAAEAVVENIMAYELAEHYQLNAKEWERVRDLSRTVDLYNARSVRRFAEAFVTEDTPSELRQQRVTNVEKLITHPEMAATMKQHNDASKEAKIIEYAKREQATNTIDKVAKHATQEAQKSGQTPAQKKQNEKLAETMLDAKASGASVDSGVQERSQKIHNDIKNGKQPDPKDVQAMGDAVTKMREHTGANIAFAKSIVSPGTRRRAEALGSDKEIEKQGFEIAKAISKAKLEGKPEPRLTPNQVAALEVYYTAQDQAAITIMSQNLAARDLEKGMGTQEQRTARAAILLQANAQFKDATPAEIKSIASSIIKNADEKGLTIDGLDELKNKAQKMFIRETVAESEWGTSLAEAQKHMLEGIEKMAKGDIMGAEESAIMTGGTVESGLKNIVGEKTAKTAGTAVSATLRTGAVNIIAASETAQNINIKENIGRSADAVKSAASDAIRQTKLSWNLKDDFAKNFSAQDKDKLAKIQAGLDKYGKGILVEVDKDGSNNLNKEEMTALLAKIDKLNATNVVNGAQPAPSSTPAAALPPKETSLKQG